MEIQKTLYIFTTPSTTLSLLIPIPREKKNKHSSEKIPIPLDITNRPNNPLGYAHVHPGPGSHRQHTSLHKCAINTQITWIRTRRTWLRAASRARPWSPSSSASWRSRCPSASSSTRPSTRLSGDTSSWHQVDSIIGSRSVWNCWSAPRWRFPTARGPRNRASGGYSRSRRPRQWNSARSWWLRLGCRAWVYVIFVDTWMLFERVNETNAKFFEILGIFLLT